MVLPILIYTAAAIFLMGNLYRFIRIARMPVHLRWELYPVPHESRLKRRYGGSYMEEDDWWTKSMNPNRAGELGVMLPEILLLKGVWEHNRPLWFWSWLMHWGLYLLVAAAALFVVGAGWEAAGYGVVARGGGMLGGGFYLAATACLWAAFTIGIIGAVGVIILRLFSRKLRLFTSFGTLFNLALILAIFALGLMSLLAERDAVRQIFAWTRQLVTLAPPPQLDGILTAFLTLLGVFLVYFPFTHMTHAFLKWFTYHSVRWDDAPLAMTAKLNRRIDKALHYPVSWSAPHIRGDGKKTWVDVATEEVKKSG